MAQQEQKRWEDAYVLQSHDARAGRLLGGLLHNLNGVIQAFSMQSDLLAMMFPKANELVDQLESKYSDTPPVELSALRELLNSRAGLTEQALEKVFSGQDILRRVAPLAVFRKSLQADKLSLNDLVRAIVEFQCGDSFFKHKIEKELNLGENIPELAGDQLVIYQLISALVENAVEALLVSEGLPKIQIETCADGEKIRLEIQDSGPGIPAASIERIFAPFYSTKKNHAGLGLYFAGKSIEDIGGQINCTSSPGATRFQLLLPCRS